MTLRAARLLLAFCCVAAVRAEEGGAPPAVRDHLQGHRAVVDSMPRHPASRAVLDGVAEAWRQAEPEEGRPVLLAVAESHPNDNLGLYALDTWLVDVWERGEEEATLSRLIQAVPDTRLAARALAHLLARSRDREALCRQTLTQHPGTRAARYARWQLASFLEAQGRRLPALSEVLTCFVAYADREPERLGRLFPALAAFFRRSALPYCAASVRGMEGRDVAYQRMAVLRLQRLVRAFENGDSPYAALWAARSDMARLKELAVNSGTNAGVRTRANLLLAARHIEGGRLALFEGQARFAIDALEGSQPETLETMWLLVDSYTYLAEVRARASSPELLQYFRRHDATNAVALMERLAAFVPSEEERPVLAGLLEHSAVRFRREGRRQAEVRTLEHLCALRPDAPDKAEWLLRMSALYASRRDHRSAAEAHGHVVQLHPDPRQRDAARVAGAVQYYLAEDYSAASAALEEELKEVQDLTLRARAQYLDTLVRFRSGAALLPVLAAVETFLRDYPEGDLEDHARCLEAYLLTVGGDGKRAAAAYRALAEAEPEGPFRRKAKEILHLLSRQEERTQAPRPEAARPRPNLVMISLDTVRADHLNCYGYSRPTSPNIDALAREGICFTRALSTSSWTKPSHASVFTGLYPSAHGALRHGDILHPETRTLAEHLYDSGFTTLATVSAPPLSSVFGFDAGFEDYDDYTYDLDRSHNLFLRSTADTFQIHSGFTASLISEAAWRVFSRCRTRERPFFFFVNYFDAHHNYFPPWPHRLETSEDYYGTQFGMIDPWLHGSVPFEDFREDVEVQRLADLYDAEVRYVDEQVGTWVERLKGAGAYERTVFVLFGDHGEEFLDHGQLTHGKTLYDEVIHVPLILAGPGVPRGLRIDTPVSLVDVLPTVLALIGVDVPKGLPGRNLLAGGGGDAETPLFAELDLPGYRFQAVARGGHKLIWNLDTDRRALYNLRDDPEERHDLAEGNAPLVEELSAVLAAFRAEAERTRRQYARDTAAAPALTADELESIVEKLRAMGYLGKK